MTSAAQVLRQADALKASVTDSSKGISETWVARQRLEDLYKKLLLMDLEYALDKKVEQELWNHAFKNHISELQSQTKDKQNPKRGETQATLNLFLETSSGFYLQLLQLVCTTFKLDLPFRRKSSCLGILKEKIPTKLKITPPKKSSCLYICQHCLVHLGDIARYRQQIEQAQTYYWHAANLLPFNGQPYNQLAIVEAAYGNKLSTVFYYIRSLAVRHPFPVAATNLEKLYFKISKDPYEFKGKLSVSEMITAFLQFQAYIHMSHELDRAECLCQKLLAALPAHVTSQSFPSGILVQIVAINIFALEHALQVEEGMAESASKEMFSKDEKMSFQLMFQFTIMVLDVLLQYTPKQEQKLKDFFTLPAVKLLFDWLKLNPQHLKNPILKTSSLWGHLCKVLNNIRPANLKDGKTDISKYEELPLTEDAELRCFQPLEKSHSNYSFSRVPSEGLSQEIESQLRCQRLLDHGKWIAEDASLHLLAVQNAVGKSGKLQFSALDNPLKVSTSEPVSSASAAPSTSSNVTIAPAAGMEKKTSRQNIAMQAIIQKKTTSESQEQEKSPGVIIKKSESVTKVSGEGTVSPKYLLGVPMSEPQFMKPVSRANDRDRQSNKNQHQTPPRFQKQHQLALQQQQQHQLNDMEDSQGPTLWQPPKYGQESPKQQQKLAWQQSGQSSTESVGSISQQSQGKLHVSPQQVGMTEGREREKISPTATNTVPGPMGKPISILQHEPRQTCSPKSQTEGVQFNLSHEPHSPVTSVDPHVSSTWQNPPSQRGTWPHHHQGSMPNSFDDNEDQAEQQDKPKPNMAHPSIHVHPPFPPHMQGMNFPPNFPINGPPMFGSTLPVSVGTPPPSADKLRQMGLSSPNMTLPPPNVLTDNMKRFPPPPQLPNQNLNFPPGSEKIAPNYGGNQSYQQITPEQKSMTPMQQEALRLQQQRFKHQRAPFMPSVRFDTPPNPKAEYNEHKVPPHMQPRMLSGMQDQHNVPQDKTPRQRYPTNKEDFGPNLGMRSPNSQQFNSPRFPAPDSNRFQSPKDFPGNFQSSIPFPPPPTQLPNNGLGPGGKPFVNIGRSGSQPLSESQHHRDSFPRNFDSAREQTGPQGLMNPLTFLNNIGKLNLANSGISGDQSLEFLKQTLHGDEAASTIDLFNALSMLAVQPPKTMNNPSPVQNRQPSSFQGHAEGTPKPESGIKPSKSPLLTPDPEVKPPSSGIAQSLGSTVGSGGQQGTYSLFSNSPWAVPLSSADCRSIGSSPFSSESNSKRNSPDPASLEGFAEGKLGLRFGDESWREKTTSPHAIDLGPAGEQGKASLYQGSYQSLWGAPTGSTGGNQSALKSLLEKQKQQKNDPH